MIKIDESKFDIKIINKIYNDLSLKICKKFKRYKELNSDDVIVLKFKEKFSDEDFFQKNIKNYLLNSRIEKIDEIINYFQHNESNFDEQTFKVVTIFFELGANTRINEIFDKLDKILDEKYIEKVDELKETLNTYLSSLNDGTFNKEIKKHCREILKGNYSYKGVIEFLEYNSEIEKIISYDILTSRQRHELINAMHIEVCPYCNRQFITSWEGDDGNFHSTADLDHFYPKSIYPIASLCLHNFIPSCQICNSRFKLAKDFFIDKHLYPYDFEFGDDAKFEIDNIDALIDQSPMFSIHQKTANSEIKNSIKTFHLNEVYKSHTDYIQELIEKVRMYNYTQIEEYICGLKGMFNTKEEILLFVFGDILNRSKCDKNPLAKLTCDILENLNIKI